MFIIDTKKLKLLLAERGINVGELAQRANLSADSIYQLMRKDFRRATFKTIGRIADALAVDCRSFIKEE